MKICLSSWLCRLSHRIFLAALVDNIEKYWANSGRDAKKFIESKPVKAYIDSINKGRRPAAEMDEIVEAFQKGTDKKVRLVEEGGKWILKPFILAPARPT